MRSRTCSFVVASFALLAAACSAGGGEGGAGASSTSATSTGSTSSGACERDCSKLPHVASGAGCDAGTCTFTCMPGYAHCTSSPGEGCETDLSQPASCGACGDACPATAPVCAPIGVTYACRPGCFNGTPILCDGGCTDTTTDPQNCGGCGNVCAAPASCVGGQCT